MHALATEITPGGFGAYVAWIQAKAIDHPRGGVAVKGGNSLNNFANIHVMMAIPHCEFFEVLMPDEAQKYGLANDIEVDAEGFVHAIDGPGLGAAIDVDLIKAKTVEVLR